jgi:hypothetical protein
MRKSERDSIIEQCAAIVDQCNREGPYQAIAAAGRIRALKDEPHYTGCMPRLLNETCDRNPDRCGFCGFEPAQGTTECDCEDPEPASGVALVSEDCPIHGGKS